MSRAVNTIKDEKNFFKLFKSHCEDGRSTKRHSRKNTNFHYQCLFSDPNTKRTTNIPNHFHI